MILKAVDPSCNPRPSITSSSAGSPLHWFYPNLLPVVVSSLRPLSYVCPSSIYINILVQLASTPRFLSLFPARLRIPVHPLQQIIMTPRQSSPDSHSDNVRKRVCKACDRCRLKKSKCDGGNPCGRCRADNAICVFGERKKAHDKVYPKGYVEMLEQQQAWLVAGLQALYRRVHDGDGWPGEPLKCEPNGHPLTHDLLTRLGALDQSKGERFEENPDAMQHELWKQNAAAASTASTTAHMQRQDSSDASSDSAHSPVAPARFVDPFAQQMPPTPPNHSPGGARGKPDPAGLSGPFTAPPLTMPGVVNPMVLQAPSQQPQPAPAQWSGNGFGGFEDVEMMGSTDLGNLSFEDPMSSPMFSRVPINCMSYMDLKSDYDDLNQFVNANAPEIAST
ncbi:hypothetical protein BDV59DRAFT_176227 [Aspergillus ambiguus]|uniref:Zn(II)2Cys6 transcription factor domain-containing protein n=1 Tax=Aspergillus ambiguus TaxID=176160 RepID=UPI003CCE16B9